MKIVNSCAILLIAAAMLMAASANGKWKASFTTPDGTARENTFNLKVDGDKLTGTVVGATGEAPITDGKVSADDVTFTVTRNFGGNDVKLLYKGKVSDNEIKFQVEMQGAGTSFEMTAKKVE